MEETPGPKGSWRKGEAGSENLKRAQERPLVKVQRRPKKSGDAGTMGPMGSPARAAAAVE